MKSQPSLSASRTNKSNFTNLLQRTSGFGVRPAAVSRNRFSTTSRRYCSSKSNVTNGMPSWPATRMASRRSSFHPHSVKDPSSHAVPDQFFMKAPITSYPCSNNKTADADESTPPDMPSRTLGLLGVIERFLPFRRGRLGGVLIQNILQLLRVLTQYEKVREVKPFIVLAQQIRIGRNRYKQSAVKRFFLDVDQLAGRTAFAQMRQFFCRGTHEVANPLCFAKTREMLKRFLIRWLG